MYIYHYRHLETGQLQRQFYKGMPLVESIELISNYWGKIIFDLCVIHLYKLKLELKNEKKPQYRENTFNTY